MELIHANAEPSKNMLNFPPSFEYCEFSINVLNKYAKCTLYVDTVYSGPCI